MSNSSEFHQPSPDGNDAAVDPKRLRYYDAVRELEGTEAALHARLGTRQESADAERQRLFKLMDARVDEYTTERSRLKTARNSAKLDLDAAHRAASEHCAEIGVHYVPGATTESDILRVPTMSESEAARRLNLPFGVGFSDRLVKILKPVLSVMCWLMSSLSLGLGFHLLDAKHLLASPVNVVLSLVMGAMVSLGLLLSVTWMWKPIGAKVGSGRPSREVFGLLIPVAFITIGMLVGLAFLDAKAIILLNAARAALNPAFGIPTVVALIIGAVISGTYVLGLAGTAFAEGYSTESRKGISGLIDADAAEKVERRKKLIPVRTALGALGHVKVVVERIRAIDEDLQRLESEFKREFAEIQAALPEMPTTLEPHEVDELTSLRHRLDSARSHHDAHVASRHSASGPSNAAP